MCVKESAELTEGILIRRMAGKEIANRPRYFSPDRYDAALTEYLNLITSYDTVRAVYRIGSCSVPGLSDIDLIIVMKDRIRDVLCRYSIERLSPEARYLFSHEAVFTGEDEFRSLPLWFPTDTATYIHGDRLPFDLGHSETRKVKVIHLCQMLTCYQLQLLLEFAYGHETLNERVTENIVKGLCNSITLWGEINPEGTASRYAEFAQAYLAFRRSWFELDEKERTGQFLEYVATATTLTLELIRDVGEYVSARWFGEVERLDNTEIRMGGNRIRFTQGWDVTAGVHAILERGPISFPASLGMFIMAYRKAPGLVGAHVRDMFGATDNIQIHYQDSETEEVVGAHQSALAAYARFYAAKFHTSPNPFITFWSPYTAKRFVRLYDRAYNRAYKLMLPKNWSDWETAS